MHARNTPRRALAPALAALAGLLAGCGGGAAPHAPQVTTYIDLVAALPGDLDPATGSGTGFESLETSLATTLVRPAAARPGAGTLAPPSRVVPALAASWTALPGGDWVFRLRRGVQSAVGNPLTGADVRFSFARELAGSRTARFLARLAKIDLANPITVLTPATVRLNVTGRSGLVAAVLAGFRFGVLDRRAVQAHATARDPTAHAWLAGHLAFYGPYRVTGFVPGVRLLLAAARAATPPAFEHIAIEAMPSARLRLADVATRAASHTSGLDWATFGAATHTGGITAQLFPSSTTDVILPNERVSPLGRAAARRALSLAIDRRAVAHTVFAGYAVPARHPQPRSTPLPAAVLAPPAYRHDTARARRLLARAGYPHGFALTLAGTASQGPEIPAELALLARQLRRAGIAATTRTVGSAAELARLERSGAVGAVLERTQAPIASVAYQVAACCVRGAPGNLEGYDSPTLDALAGDTTRAAQQRSLVILAADDPAIAVVEIPSQNVTLPEIRGDGAYAAQGTYYDGLRR